MGIDWILIVLLGVIWLAAGGIHWKALKRNRVGHQGTHDITNDR